MHTFTLQRPFIFQGKHVSLKNKYYCKKHKKDVFLPSFIQPTWMGSCLCRAPWEAPQRQERPEEARRRENKGIGDDVHFNNGCTLDLSGEIGANSQQEIREHFNLIIIQGMTFFWAGLSCVFFIPLSISSLLFPSF